MSTYDQNLSSETSNSDTFTHAEVAELLGAYAIHAVDEHEVELVEIHLEYCELCQVELSEHFGTAARLGAASVMPVAPKVWDSVLAEIRSTPVHVQTVADSVPSNVIDFSAAKLKMSKRRTWRVAVAAAVAGAAITVPIVSSFSGSSPSLAALAERVAEQPSSRSMMLKSSTGEVLANVVVGQDHQGYLTRDSLPKLSSDKAYQLWAVTETGPVSLGILGADPSLQAFVTPSTYAALAISVENENGAATPTPPIAVATV